MAQWIDPHHEIHILRDQSYYWLWVIIVNELDLTEVSPFSHESKDRN